MSIITLSKQPDEAGASQEYSPWLAALVKFPAEAHSQAALDCSRLWDHILLPPNSFLKSCQRKKTKLKERDSSPVVPPSLRAGVC